MNIVLTDNIYQSSKKMLLCIPIHLKKIQLHFSLLHICVRAGCFSAILWLNAYKYVQKYVSVHKHKCMLSQALAYPNRFIYNYFVYSTQISLLLQPNGSPVSMLGSMKLLVHYHYFLITVFFSYLWRLQSCWTSGILLSPSEILPVPRI